MARRFGILDIRRPSLINTQLHQYWWSAQGGNNTQKRDHGGLESEKLTPLVRYARAQRRTTNVPRRIYVLGAGNIGGFVAHSLAGLPHRPPITLLLPSQRSLANWHEGGASIKLTVDGLLDMKSGFDVEHIQLPQPARENGIIEHESTSTSSSPHEPQGEIIYNLVVSVKAFNTVDAIRRVAHRLTQNSSILFIQNGMGIIEEVNDKVFPDPATRPQYMIGIISHGIYHTKPFNLIHAGHGTTALTILPRNIEDVKLDFESSALYLLRTMTRTPILAAVGFAPTDLFQLQIEKLAVNAIINPLSAILGCLNGGLLHQPSISRIIRLLLAEICLVIKSLPELQGVPNVKMRFDIKRLEGQVISIATKTAANRSSTLQDISRGRPTEIEYITGYIIRRGEEIGIQCVLNYMLKHMVRAKGRLEEDRHDNMLPLQPRNSL